MTASDFDDTPDEHDWYAPRPGFKRTRIGATILSVLRDEEASRIDGRNKRVRLFGPIPVAACISDPDHPMVPRELRPLINKLIEKHKR